MQNLTFDAHGYLTPSEKITIDLSTLEQVFVKDFPNSESRKGLFDNYLRYLDAFAKEITPHFTQWINSSFVTQKENPKDIDFVTFIDADIYYVKQGLIESKYLSYALEQEGLDAFVMRIYPKDDFLHEAYTIHHANLWYERFTNTRKNGLVIAFSKGFLEINNSLSII